MPRRFGTEWRPVGDLQQDQKQGIHGARPYGARCFAAQGRTSVSETATCFS